MYSIIYSNMFHIESTWKTTVYQMITPQVSVFNYLLKYVPHREYVEDNCYQMITPQVSVFNYLLQYVPHREYVEDNCYQMITPQVSVFNYLLLYVPYREYVEDNCLQDDSTSGQCIQLFTQICSI